MGNTNSLRRWPCGSPQMQIKSMLVFGERENRSTWGKTSQIMEEKRTNSTHIWCRVRESNSHHIGRRRVLSTLCQPYAKREFKIYNATSTGTLFEIANSHLTIVFGAISSCSTCAKNYTWIKLRGTVLTLGLENRLKCATLCSHLP